MDAFVSGAWRNPKRGVILIGGVFRRITRGVGFLEGDWRSIVQFTSPMTVSANNINASKANRGKPVQVNGISTCTPTGGVAPYTYSWIMTSGSATIGSPSFASTSIYESLPAGETTFSTARVTCTDAVGTSAFADITITLTNEGF